MMISCEERDEIDNDDSWCYGTLAVYSISFRRQEDPHHYVRDKFPLGNFNLYIALRIYIYIHKISTMGREFRSPTIDFRMTLIQVWSIWVFVYAHSKDKDFPSRKII